MDRNVQPLLVDVAVGLAAGLFANWATDLAQRPLRRATPEGARRREAQVSPGPSSSHVAARRIAERLGRPVDERRLRPVAKAVHYGLGMVWGPVYCLLRRHVGMRPLGAGLVAGAALSLVVDEGLTPALGLSAPNRAYPVATHVRGFLAHLVWGAAGALAAEAGYRVTGTTPGRAGSPVPWNGVVLHPRTHHAFARPRESQRLIAADQHRPYASLTCPASTRT